MTTSFNLSKGCLTSPDIETRSDDAPLSVAMRSSHQESLRSITSVDSHSSSYTHSSVEQAAKKDIEGLGLTLHGLHVDQTAIELGTYKKFSSAELTSKRLHVVNGQLVVGEKKTLLNTNGKDIMYVMHPTREIFVDYPLEGVCYHSSLMGDHYPLAAGMMRILNGRVTSINEHSGHFAPTNRIALIFEELNKHGAKIVPETVITHTSHHPIVHRAAVLSPSGRQQTLSTILAKKTIASPSLASRATLPPLSPDASHASSSSKAFLSSSSPISSHTTSTTSSSPPLSCLSSPRSSLSFCFLPSSVSLLGSSSVCSPTSSPSSSARYRRSSHAEIHTVSKTFVASHEQSSRVTCVDEEGEYDKAVHELMALTRLL